MSSIAKFYEFSRAYLSDLSLCIVLVAAGGYGLWMPDRWFRYVLVREVIQHGKNRMLVDFLKWKNLVSKL